MNLLNEITSHLISHMHNIPELNDQLSIINYFYLHREKYFLFYKSYLPHMLTSLCEDYISFTDSLVYILKKLIHTKSLFMHALIQLLKKYFFFRPKFISNALMYVYEKYCSNVFNDLLPILNRSDYLLELKVLMIKYKSIECIKECEHVNELNEYLLVVNFDLLEERPFLSPDTSLTEISNRISEISEEFTYTELNDKLNSINLNNNALTNEPINNDNSALSNEEINKEPTNNLFINEPINNDNNALNDEFKLNSKYISESSNEIQFNTNDLFFNELLHNSCDKSISKLNIKEIEIELEEFNKYFNYKENISCKLTENGCIHSQSKECNNEIYSLFLEYKDTPKFIVKLLIDYLSVEYSYELFLLLMNYRKEYTYFLSRSFYKCNLLSLSTFICINDIFINEEMIDKGLFVLQFIKYYKLNLRASSNVVSLYLEKYNLRELRGIYYECIKLYKINDRLIRGLIYVIKSFTFDDTINEFINYHKENINLIPCLPYLDYKFINYFITHPNWRIRYSLYQIKDALNENDLNILKNDKVYLVRNEFNK
ncbi:hypothetical protein H311_02355 [Anncaliia algerae PRA109]|nr:hypothetical protein H311_02355 [Anncaliia algerae PRA109]